MEVCRMRDTPVIVFINKMDRDGQNPFDLIDDIENDLKISLHPLSWPINSGKDFKGVYSLYDKSLLLFQPNQKANESENVKIEDLADPALDNLVGEKDANSPASVGAAAEYSASKEAILALMLPYNDDSLIAAARVADVRLPLLVPVNMGELRTFRAADEHVYAVLDLNHS